MKLCTVFYSFLERSSLKCSSNNVQPKQTHKLGRLFFNFEPSWLSLESILWVLLCNFAQWLRAEFPNGWAWGRGAQKRRWISSVFVSHWCLTLNVLLNDFVWLYTVCTHVPLRLCSSCPSLGECQDWICKQPAWQHKVTEHSRRLLRELERKLMVWHMVLTIKTKLCHCVSMKPWLFKTHFNECFIFFFRYSWRGYW